MRTQIKWWLSIALAVIGCSNESLNPGPDQGVSVGNGRGENYLQMEADLTDAVSLTATLPQDPANETRQLLKVTRGNKFEQIFSGKHQLFNYKITPTHIIAHVNIWEDRKHCSLIAIPKIQGKTPVLCLNRELVSCREDDISRDYIGYDVRGTGVYFSYQEVTYLVAKNSTFRSCSTNAAKGSQHAAVSELRYWDGKSEKVQTLFHTEPQPVAGTQIMVRDVFASTSNENLCIDTDNVSESTLFCKKTAAGDWAKIPNMKNNSSSTPFLKQLNTLLTTNDLKLDLSTLTSTKRTGPLPEKVDFILENDGVLGSNYHNVIKVSPSGDSEIVMPLEFNRVPPARLGNWGWYITGDSLRRFNLSEGELDPKDYFSVTTLLRLSGVSWALGDFLRVDGTGTSGMPKKSYLTMQGELVYVEAPSVQVEHPIELKWEN